MSLYVRKGEEGERLLCDEPGTREVDVGIKKISFFQANMDGQGAENAELMEMRSFHGRGSRESEASCSHSQLMRTIIKALDFLATSLFQKEEAIQVERAASSCC